MIHRTITEYIKYDTYEDIHNDEKLAGHTSKDISKYVMNPDGSIEVTLEYSDQFESRPVPKLLPAHLKTEILVIVKSEELKDILQVLKDREKYFPNLFMKEYRMSQEVGEEAILNISLANYESEDNTSFDDEYEGSIF